MFLQNMLERQNGVDDLTLMTGEVNDENVANQLGQRMQQGKIYTQIANVLIASNPFTPLPIFGASHVKMYQSARLSDSKPHIFGLAERAYRTMVTKQAPQACIISGESGAGKTESAKLILHYISSVSGTTSGVAQKMKKVIFDVNPLLESFGNAKTSRNNNSSRFGKYLNLQFTQQGEPIGGFTTNFLLEKSRVTFAQRGERTFHVFYQLVSAAWPELKQACNIGGISDFRYLSQSGCDNVDGIDDREMFREVTNAMVTVGIQAEEQWYIFSCLGAILHIGNISLEGSDAPARLGRGSEYSMEIAAYLLGVDQRELVGAITHKTVTMGGRGKEVVKVPQNADQASQIRDALAKELYSRIFDLIVARVNAVMDPRANRMQPAYGCTIGLLDIYGFEIFEQNSFEQFCINYVNEKLQQIFIDLTLRGEQQLYHQEGVKVKVVPFFDNKVVCELLEGANPPGVFRLLDDTCRAIHAVDSETADTKFGEKLSGLSSPYFNLTRNTSNYRGGFIVTHYAGKVSYSFDGFCEKNKDNLFSSVITTMQQTQNPFIKMLWANDVISAQAPTTSGQKIRASAQALVDELRKTETHYIRCIKSNDQKRPMYMDMQRVTHQVKYLGLRANVMVYKAGYSYRSTYYEFLQQFEILLSRNQGQLQGASGARQLTDHLCRKYSNDIKPDEFAFGQSMIFISSPVTVFFMQELREQAIDPQGYAERLRLHEAAEQAALVQERKLKKGTVVKKGAPAGGCVVS